MPALANAVLTAISAAFWQPGRHLREVSGGAVILDRHGKQIARLNTDGLTPQKRWTRFEALGVTESLSAGSTVNVELVVDPAWRTMRSRR